MMPGKHHHVRCLVGWLLMLVAFAPAVYQLGRPSPRLLGAGMVLAGILVVYLLLLRPVLGDVHEWKAQGASLAIFISASVGFACLLGNEGDYPLAMLGKLVHGLFESAILSPFLPPSVAEQAANPVIVIGALLILLALAYRATWLIGLAGVVAVVYGLYPPRPVLFIGVILWAAGFVLLRRTPMFLPEMIHSRLELSEDEREFLVEVRSHARSEQEVAFLWRSEHDSIAHDEAALSRLRLFGDAGLLVRDPDTGLVAAGRLLQGSDRQVDADVVLERMQVLAAGALVLAAAAYLAWPLDVLPDWLLGPVGHVDDLVIAALALLPGGQEVVRLVARTGRRAVGLLPEGGPGGLDRG